MRRSSTNMSEANPLFARAAPSYAAAPRPHLAGVLYAEDFDEAAPPPSSAGEPAPEPEVIEPVFSAAELDRARAEGRAAGLAEAERSIGASRLQVLRLIAENMSNAQEAACNLAADAADAAARCMLTALTACLPALCTRHGANELRAFVRIVLPALIEEPQITVRVHPHMIAVLQDELASMDFDIAERITLQPADAVMPGDVRVTWSAGSASRQGARARAAVEEALAMLGLLDCQTHQPETVNA